LTIWFGEFRFTIESRLTYFVALKYAPGAEANLPVRRAGIRVGEVRAVEYDEDKSLVFLTLSIDPAHPLRLGDEPTLRRSLLGDTELELVAGKDAQGVKDRPIIPPGTILEGVSPFDASSILSDADQTVPNLNKSLVDIRAAAQKWTSVGDRVDKLLAANGDRVTATVEQLQSAVTELNEALEGVNNVLTPEVQADARNTVTNLRKSSDDLQKVMAKADELIDRLNGTVGEIDAVSKNLQRATKPVADRSESTMKNIDESAASLNVLLVDAKAIAKQLREQDGTFQRLTSDPSLYRNVDDAAFLLVRNLNQFEKILKDLQVFADKIARHPGELGVPGVISRDGGLKDEVPTGAGRPHGLLRR
ncbi:MAG: MlaD family protein, partial [Planctomycetia bacterium]